MSLLQEEKEFKQKEESMINELFLMEADKVLLVTACIAAAMTLFYVEVMALNECKTIGRL